jgi:hypothetical protein
MKFLIPIIASAALITPAESIVVFVPIDITTGSGSTATQSTPATGVTPPGSGFPDRAINGNLGDFTHTTPGDPNPSLTVDLGRDETFSRIIVHNRDNCCADRLADITVEVFDDADDVVYTSGPLNVGNTLGSPTQLTLDLPAVTGRKITISRAGGTGSAPGVLSIGELQIGRVEEVTLPPGSDLTAAGIQGMTVSQSPTSASPPGGGVPSNGVDGNLNNFTHTNANLNVTHTWQVDFGEEVLIEEVDLRNRANCCGERLRDITVSILDANGETVLSSEVLNPGNTLNFLGTNQAGLLVDFVALNGGSPVRGQTVVVSRTPDETGVNPDDQSVLSLGEVIVTGSSAGPAEGVVITSITVSGGEAELTWTSSPGETFTISRSFDLENWDEDIADGYPEGGATGDTTSITDTNLGGATTLFYRIERE